MEILEALRLARECVRRSDDDAWSTRSLQSMEKKLDRLIRSVERGRKPKLRLGLLILPTGNLQEISITNGWGDEYLAIADAVAEFLSS